MKNKDKIFNDPIYGYICIPDIFVKNLIDTFYFQRLRNIDQTGMKVLYQNVKHDRFSHSLGVFHLGFKAIDSLQSNIENLIYIKKIEVPKYFIENIRVTFLSACLLHDIGHTPFSHSLEELVLANSKVDSFKKNKKNSNSVFSVEEKLIDIITFYENKYCTFYSQPVEEKPKISNTQHEQLGALFIFEKLKSNISNIIYDIFDQASLNGEEFTEEEKQIIIDDDLCFIARMIMGSPYKSWHIEKQIKNCFISLLNGENFDVDNLDYILRDTFMSGINSITFDVNQLLNSICLVSKTKHFNKINLENKDINLLSNLAITKFKNNSNKQIHLKGNLKGTIILKNASKIQIEKNTLLEIFSGLNGERAKISYTSRNQASFKKGVNLIENGEVKKNNREEITLWGEPTGKVFECYISDGVVVNPFYFQTKSDVCIKLYGYCDILIDGCFESETPVTIFNIEELSGSIDEIEVLGDSFEAGFMNTIVPNSQSHYTFSIGFKKKAMNIIANILDARNYLYLWIYAQYKVVYYANFLIPVIANFCFVQSNNLNWLLDYNHLENLDDSYVWSVMKNFYISNYAKKNQKIKLEKSIKNYLNLCEELFNHTYKDVLYKSLAEYEIFFEKFTTKEKNKIFDFFNSKLDVNKPNLQINNIIKAGFIKQRIINEINNIIAETSSDLQTKNLIKELIFVPAIYKRKRLDAQKVFLKLDKDKVIPISEVPLLKSQCHSNDDLQIVKFFYLYYELNDNKYDKSIEKIQTALIKYLENELKII